jgi:hypothetical protein
MSLIQQQWIGHLVQLCFLYVALMITDENNVGTGQEKQNDWESRSSSSNSKDYQIVIYIILGIGLLACLVVGGCYVFIAVNPM